MDFDWLVIGSGFGGSVSALRLAQKGYRVGVLECGRRFADDELPKSTWDAAPLLVRAAARAERDLPADDLQGRRDRVRLRRRRRVARLRQHALPRARPLLRGPAVGGARRLAGRARAALRRGRADARRRHLRRGRSRRRLPARVRGGDRGRRRPTPRRASACSWASAGKTVTDPFFGGEGPDRTGCLRCGRCMVGCPHGAKNTLVKNYLYFAERAGVRIMPERTVTDIRPLDDGGYAVTASARAPGSRAAQTLTAQGRRRRRGRAGHEPPAGGVQAQRLAPEPLAAPRRARAHQLRGDPRRHAPRGRARA